MHKVFPGEQPNHTSLVVCVMDLKNFCSVRYGIEGLCRLLPFASVGFNVIRPAKAGSTGLSTPDGGSRAILGQPGVWMGDHL